MHVLFELCETGPRLDWLTACLPACPPLFVVYLRGMTTRGGAFFVLLTTALLFGVFDLWQSSLAILLLLRLEQLWSVCLPRERCVGNV